MMLQGYQFWVRADVKGNFFIKNVLSGVYNLYAWFPGFIGEFNYNTIIKVISGELYIYKFVSSHVWSC